jgi:3-phenylpropionate/cinnamic acid dioxygenase small subunit
MSISIEDRLAIHEVLALYGHLLDEDRWDDFHQVFAEEFAFDGTMFGFGVMHSVEELKANWASNEHRNSLQHHTTNVVVTEGPDGTVHAVSKAIGVGMKGRSGSATYRDVLIRTSAGWRLASRQALLPTRRQVS